MYSTVIAIRRLVRVCVCVCVCQEHQSDMRKSV